METEKQNLWILFVTSIFYFFYRLYFIKFKSRDEFEKKANEKRLKNKK